MDTPGFDPENEKKSFIEICRGIQAVSEFSKISGILYLTCINQPRFDNFDHKLLKFIHAISGDKYLPQVTFITTFCTTSSAREGESFNKRLKDLQKKWKIGIAKEALGLYQHGRLYDDAGQDTGSFLNWFDSREQIAKHAKDMVSRRYGVPKVPTTGTCVPRILAELGNGISVQATTTGKLLGMASDEPRRHPSSETETSTPGASSSRTGREVRPEAGLRSNASEAQQRETEGSGTWFLPALGKLLSGIVQNVNFEVNFGGTRPGLSTYGSGSGSGFNMRGGKYTEMRKI